MIKRKYTKPYERKIISNKMEYSAGAGPYFTTYGVKVPLFMPEFSSSKIISHRFHVDKTEVESGIGYYMIIVHDLMVQIGLSNDFKRQVLQWDGATVPTKEPNGLIG